MKQNLGLPTAASASTLPRWPGVASPVTAPPRPGSPMRSSGFSFQGPVPPRSPVPCWRTAAIGSPSCSPRSPRAPSPAPQGNALAPQQQLGSPVMGWCPPPSPPPHKGSPPSPPPHRGSIGHSAPGSDAGRRISPRNSPTMTSRPLQPGAQLQPLPQQRQLQNTVASWMPPPVAGEAALPPRWPQSPTRNQSPARQRPLSPAASPQPISPRGSRGAPLGCDMNTPSWQPPPALQPANAALYGRLLPRASGSASSPALPTGGSFSLGIGPPPPFSQHPQCQQGVFTNCSQQVGSVPSIEMQVLAAPPDQDISSIHAVSPLSCGGSEKDEKEDDISHQCEETTKLVNKLAAVIKGLEADVDSLRRENRNLRKGMQAAAQGSDVCQARCEGSGNEFAGAQPSSREGSPVPVVDASKCQAPRRSSGQGLLAQRNCVLGCAQQVPTSKDRAGQSPTNSSTAHASPHFGQTPGLSAKGIWPSSAAGGSKGCVAQPQTPSPGRRSGTSHDWPPNTMCPPGHNSLAAETSAGTPGTDRSPALDSTATIMGPLAVQDGAEGSTSPVGRRTATPRSSESTPPGRRASEGGVAPGERDRRGSGAIASPVAVLDAAPWSVDQTVWLGREGNEDRIPNKLRVLDKDSINSVTMAVDGLNRGSVKCADDAVVVYSASNRGFYLIYRRGLKEKAHQLALSIKVDEDISGPPCRADEAAGNAGPRLSGGSSVVALTEPRSAPGSAAAENLQGSLAAQDAAPQQSPQQQSRRASSDAASCGGGADQVKGPSQPPEQNSQEETSMQQDVFWNVDTYARHGEAAKAEDLLLQAVRTGQHPTQECVNGDSGKAEEWLWQMIDAQMVPSEASFNLVVLAKCNQGLCQEAEYVMGQMMRLGVQPSKQMFDNVISAFAEKRDAAKVEEWLLQAGQSGWTPDQAAFDAVVLLYAERDSLKAEEWLTRYQQTEYRLPDECYDAVILAFVRGNNVHKANEWLSRMMFQHRLPSDSTLHQVIVLLMERRDVKGAESWLAQLSGRSTASTSSLRQTLFDAAMSAGELTVAERQLAALNVADPGRTCRVAMAHAERGDGARSKALLERYRALGGATTLEINAAMLAACSASGDAIGAEAAARAVASLVPLTSTQVAMLRHAMAEDVATALIAELNGEPSTGTNDAATWQVQALALQREQLPPNLPTMAVEARPDQSQPPSTTTTTTTTTTSQKLGAATGAAGRTASGVKAAAKVSQRRNPAGNSGARARTTR